MLLTVMVLWYIIIMVIKTEKVAIQGIKLVTGNTFKFYDVRSEEVPLDLPTFSRLNLSLR